MGGWPPTVFAVQERIRRFDESVVIDLGEAVLVRPPEVARRGGVEEVAEVRGARAVVRDLCVKIKIHMLGTEIEAASMQPI